MAGRRSFPSGPFRTLLGAPGGTWGEADDTWHVADARGANHSEAGVSRGLPRQTGIRQGYRPATMEADDPLRAFIDWEGQTELKLTLQSLIPEALRTSGGFLPA